MGGVCYACLYSWGKKSINWDARLNELKDIVASVKTRGGAYDCVCGVSGGKDSTYTALYARDKLKLRTLLVNSEPEGITDRGKKNIENLKNLGFDCIQMRPNPQLMRKLVRRDFYKYLNPVKITEFSLWASAYIIAEKFNIPLIIQGENPALTLGVSKCLDVSDDALNAEKQDTLASGWGDYIYDNITPKELFMFHYDADKLREMGTRAIWIQYYDKDWSPRRNAKFSVEHGLTLRSDFKPVDIGTYVNFAQLDSDLVQVNQMFKYYKFGFGQCTDYACYDIRDGLITREEGIELVEKYDGKCHPKYIKKFCDYIGITEDEMWQTVEKFTNKELFKKVDGKWERNFRVG